MSRRPQLKVVWTPDGYKVDVPASLSESGKRERFYHADETAAKKQAAGLRRVYHERGTSSSIIDPELAAEALRAKEILLPFGVSILAACRDYVARNSHAGAVVTVSEAW